MSSSPEEPKEGDLVTHDSAIAHEEVGPARAEDKDQGRGHVESKDEPAEMPQRQQIYPNCR
jgi:hypothetical protein